MDTIGRYLSAELATESTAEHLLRGRSSRQMSGHFHHHGEGRMRVVGRILVRELMAERLLRRRSSHQMCGHVHRHG